MIVDLILNRQERSPYTPKKFYDDVVSYGEIGSKIASAMDSGTETDVKRTLCTYIDENGYNPEIKNYINSVPWLDCNILKN